MNPLLSADSYKLSHWKQYPEGTEHVYSYIEARTGDTPIVVFGVNEFVQQISCGLTEWNVDELRRLTKNHGVPFNEAGFARLLEKHGETQEFPVLVRAVPEGTVVSSGTVVATIVNTDPEFPWLSSFFETLFLRCVWYPSTVASISRAAKVVIKQALVGTGDPAGIQFKLHDFGARGVSSGESAQLGGAAHLINFQGTDTIEALEYVETNHMLPEGTCAGYSIPATEHSTVTSWGRDHEQPMYAEFIRANLGPGKIGACVSDSYNIDEALKMWKQLEPLLLEIGGTLVIRPDSGDPVSMPVSVIKELMNLFGYTTNAKGYKVLPSHIRVIQGDGITLSSLQEIITALIAADISIDNIAFGMGGGLLQHCDRDTFGWAMKCSAARVNGVWRDVYKDPVGGNKKSKRGLVVPYGTIAEEQVFTKVPYGSSMVTYYHGESGYLRPADHWEVIRDRAEV